MKIKISLLALIFSMALVGCSNQESDNNELNDNETKNNVKQEETQSNKENEKEEVLEIQNIQQDKTNEKENKAKEDLTEKQESKDEVKKEEIKKEESNEAKADKVDLKIYTLDPNNTQNVVEFSTVSVDKDASVEDNITSLLQSLKHDYFKDTQANMYLESIDNSIATINIVGEDGWRDKFQGSEGAYINQSTIIETLLQKPYKGDWIKGVNVLIDGKKQEVFDHASFTEVFYR